FALLVDGGVELGELTDERPAHRAGHERQEGHLLARSRPQPAAEAVEGPGTGLVHHGETDGRVHALAEPPGDRPPHAAERHALGLLPGGDRLDLPPRRWAAPGGLEVDLDRRRPTAPAAAAPSASLRRRSAAATPLGRLTHVL